MAAPGSISSLDGRSPGARHSWESRTSCSARLRESAARPASLPPPCLREYSVASPVSASTSSVSYAVGERMPKLDPYLKSIETGRSFMPLPGCLEKGAEMPSSGCTRRISRFGERSAGPAPLAMPLNTRWGAALN